MVRLRVVLVVILAVATIGAVGCSQSTERRVIESEVESHTDSAFYEVPSPLPAGEPGAMIRTEDLLGAPDGMRAWRILYHSRDVTGADVPVSGVVLAPDGGDASSNRAIVSWGHPTTGVAQRCAPSLGVDPFVLIEGARALVDAGYVVVATDYPGMGVAGPSQYLIGTSEGNSVLDAARAARTIPETGAGSRLLLWGHSQGGQAALFAAQAAPTYAPELDLKAVAVAAPAVELGELLDLDRLEDAGVTLGSYAFSAYADVYKSRYPDLSLDQIVTSEGQAAIPEILPLCLLTQSAELKKIAKPLVGNFQVQDPSKTEPWATLLTENTPGAVVITAPVLVAQGGKDDLVRPETTAQYVQHLCSQQVAVDAKVYPDRDHGTVALRAVDDVVAMFRDALDGKSPTSTC